MVRSVGGVVHTLEGLAEGDTAKPGEFGGEQSVDVALDKALIPSSSHESLGWHLHPMGLVWVAIVVVFTLFGEGGRVLSASFWFSGQGVGTLLNALLPVFLLSLLGVMREQFRRITKQNEALRASIGRFAEPEPESSGKIISIRHAVRRELSALNEQLDRSLNATSEIESVIQREVGTLERSFAENERRMLELVQELARQRETVVTATEQVQGVVRGSREALTSELANLASQVLEAGNYARGVVEEANLELRSELSNQGDKFAETLRHVVEEKIHPISQLLGDQVRSVDALLSDGSGSLVAAFRAQSHDLLASLEEVRVGLEDGLQAHSTKAEEVATKLTDTIGASLESGINRVESKMESASIEILGLLDAGANQASQRLADVAASSMIALDGKIDQLHSNADAQVQRLTGLVDSAAKSFLPALERHNGILEKAIDLEGAFEHTTGRLNDVLSHKATAFVDAVARNVRDFQTQIVDQTNHISSGLADKLDRAVENLDEGSKRFESTLRVVQDSVAVATDKLTITVAEHNTAFAQRVEQIESLIANGTDRIDEHLAKGAAQLSLALDKGRDELNAAFDKRTDHLSELFTDGLESAESAFKEHITSLGAVTSDHHKRVEGTFDSAISSLNGLIESGSNVLASAAEQAQAQLQATTVTFDDDLRGLWTKFSSDLTTFTETSTSSLAAVGAENVSALEAKMVEVTDTMQDRVSSIYSSLDARTRELEANITDFGASIDTQTSRLNRVIGQKSETLEQSIELGVGRFDAAMVTHLEKTKEALGKFASEEAELFHERLGALKRALDGQSEALTVQVTAVQDVLDVRSHDLLTSVSQFGAGVESQVKLLNQVVGQRSLLIEQNVERGVQQIDEVLSNYLKRSESIGQAFVTEEAANFDRQIEVLSRTFDSRSEILDSIMRTRGADFTDQLYASSKQFEQELTETSRSLQKVLTEGESSLQQWLATQTAEMRAAFDAAVQQAQGAVDDRIAEIDTRLEGASSRLGLVMQKNSEQLLGSLVAQTNVLEDALKTNSSKLDSLLSQEGARLSESLREGADKLETVLDAGAAKLQEHLRGQATSLAAVFDESGEKAERAVKLTTRDLEKSVEESVSNLKDAMEKSMGSAEQLLTKGTEETLQQLHAGVEVLLTRLAQHEKNAVSRMENAAANVGETTRKAAELAAERLVTVNGALVKVLSSLGANRPSSRKQKSEVVSDAAE